MQQVVRRCRINFEGMTETHLLGWNTSDLREAFVDELRGDNGVLGFECIGSSQIIIFTGIDNDASSGIDAPGEEVIDKRAFHVDVADKFEVFLCRISAPEALSGRTVWYVVKQALRC